MARIQLPSSLSDKTKRKLLKLSPKEVAEAVDNVNYGSVESIDKLVNIIISENPKGQL